MVQNFEPADFVGIAHMWTNAGANVVIAYEHQTDGSLRTFGQLTEISQQRGFGKGHHAVGNRQVLPDDFIDTAFDFNHEFVRWSSINEIVAFTLFTLDVAVHGTLAAEHPNHGLVQNMLG